MYVAKGAAEYRGHPGLALAWSKTGEQLAVLHLEDDPELGAKERFAVRLVVMDADGSNATQVYKANGNSGLLLGFDWR